MLERGERIRQETLLWDDVEQVTRSMRSKEFAEDYRYFPDPDLVEVHVSKEWQEEIKRNLPELQDAKRERFIREYELPEYDARILTSSKTLADYFEKALKVHNSPKAVSNWIMTEVLRELKKREIEADEFQVSPERLAQLIKMIEEGTISGKIAKQVFADTIESNKSPEEIVRDKGLVQITDEKEIVTAVEEAIAASEKAVEQYKKGKDRALGYIVGQVMKKTKGKANPALVNKLIKEKLDAQD